MAAARQKKQEDDNTVETNLVNQLAKGIGIGIGAAAAAGILQVLTQGQQAERQQQQPKPKQEEKAKKKKAPAPPPPKKQSPPPQPPAAPKKKTPNKQVTKSPSTSSIASSSASSSTGSLPLSPKKSHVAASATVATPSKTIVIAVHASKKQAGGLLFLPRTKVIHFYSIKWSEYFEIPDDRDRIQLLNACFALEIFASFLQNYRRGGSDRLKVKTGFKGCLTPATGSEFLKKLTAKIEAEPFRGEWRYYAQSTDPHQKIAERLGNKEWKPESSTLPNTKPDHSYLVPDFKLFNISKSDLAAVHSLALEASDEFK